MNYNNIFAVSLAVILAGCGGSSDDTDTVLKGAFLDSAVMGLSYSTATQSGVTDQDGMLNYLDGETVTLSLGQLSLPPFLAKETMSPLDVFNTTDVGDVRVLNLATLLQSLDADSNPDNGIEILDAAVTNAPATIDFSKDTSAFAEDVAVLNLVANSGSTSTELVSPAVASQHLQTTLVDSGDLESFSPLDYTDIVVGNTITYSEAAGGKSYYYRPDGARFTIENGSVIETAWELDESGAICEVTVRGDTFCVGDASNYMMTKLVGGTVYNYSDSEFTVSFTVAEGDSLSLSTGGNLESFSPLDYTDIVVGNTITYSEAAGGKSYYYRPDGARFTIENGSLIETTWKLDESGAICEVTVQGETFCVGDASNYMMTKLVGGNVYNYSDSEFTVTFTVNKGDSLSLSN